MYKFKMILSICIFSILLVVTSMIKTQTRILEKHIYKNERKIFILQKDLHETQLDYSYLSTPSFLSEKIKEFAYIEYFPIDFSRIYLNYSDFSNAKKKIKKLKIKKKKEKK